MLSITLFCVIAINAVLGQWELLAEQNINTGGYFTSAVASSNVGAEGDALYSKIAGISDSSVYQEDDGKYHFKLRYIPGDGSGEQIVEFRQSNWLTDSTPSGLEIISQPSFTITSNADCYDFIGLARSSSTSNCFIDGDGTSGGCWWNCVASYTSHTEFGQTGIPGNNGKVAHEMQLFVAVEDVDADCSALDIDGYLDYCSANWASVSDDVSGLSSLSDSVQDNTNAINANAGLIDTNTGNIASNAGNIDTNTATISSIQTTITTMQDSIDLLSNGPLSPLSAQIGIGNYDTGSLSILTGWQNYLIVLSVCLNIVLISFMCVMYRKLNTINGQHEYKKVRVEQEI